jgi:hypothetical protein
MKALLILLAAAWITTDANATSEGERAPGLADKRFVSTYLYAAVRPATANTRRVSANTRRLASSHLATANTRAVIGAAAIAQPASLACRRSHLQGQNVKVAVLFCS